MRIRVIAPPEMLSGAAWQANPTRVAEPAGEIGSATRGSESVIVPLSGTHTHAGGAFTTAGDFSVSKLYTSAPVAAPEAGVTAVSPVLSRGGVIEGCAPP